MTIIGADASCLQRVRLSASVGTGLYFIVPAFKLYIGPPSYKASLRKSDLYIPVPPAFLAARASGSFSARPVARHACGKRMPQRLPPTAPRENLSPNRSLASMFPCTFPEETGATLYWEKGRPSVPLGCELYRGECLNFPLW